MQHTVKLNYGTIQFKRGFEISRIIFGFQVYFFYGEKCKMHQIWHTKKIMQFPNLFCFDFYPNLNSKSNFIKLIYGGIAMENYLALCKGESRSEEN